MIPLHVVSIFLILTSPLLQAQAWKGEIHQDLPTLKKKADAGDATAMAEYAFHSLRCMGGLKFQPKLIFDYFTKSAAKGNHDGQVGLAHCYCFNVGTVRNVRRASHLIKEPFARNHPVALKIMGYLYYGHHDVKKRNLEKVREFNRKSAALGCIAAEYNLGIEYSRKGPDQDMKKAMGIFRQLHEKRIFPMASAELFKTMRSHKIWEDQDDLHRECLERLKEYGDLQERSALLKLGNFYHEAGDMETAVSYYTQSAHLGDSSAWFELWRQAAYGHHGDDSGIVWGHEQSIGNMAMRAYERGVFTSRSLSDAGWEITRRSWNKGYQEKLPRLEKDLLKHVATRCSLHDILGRLYLRAQKSKNPNLMRPGWARNHLIAHSHHGVNATGELTRHYFSLKPTTENLAKGYACALATQKQMKEYWDQGFWERTEKKMTPEAKKRATRLIADQFPNGDTHRRRAEDFLIKIGHLPPRP
ncbi:MAG: hypothetical protein ABF332_02900 [Akkermansiaceae bacterium]